MINLWLAVLLLWCIAFLTFLVGIVWFLISGGENTAALMLMVISCILMNALAVILNLIIGM
nr:MAG TPA: hypothetical protein [Caudoviricetes sp.]